MKTRKRINKNAVYIVSFLLIVLLSIIYKVILSGKSASMFIKGEETSESAEETSDIAGEAASEGEQDRTVNIYICGAVNDPGVYELEAGALLCDAVENAGGFTENAADEYIDLVYVIDGNISVYIPTLDEIETEGAGAWGNQQIYFRADPALSSEGGADASNASGLINLNTASREQLMTLPGIGETTADAIIAYREETPFTSIQDITNVSGIGESKYDRIKDLICV